MFDLKRIQINKLADGANFNRNTTEKVLRLYSILDFLNKDELEGLLVLKGGTAINLFLLELPRLSVDIDLDFNLPLSREEMLEKRKVIDKAIRGFMADRGIGIRIKDDLLVTEEGCEVLTAEIIKEADDIEAYLATKRSNQPI